MKLDAYPFNMNCNDEGCEYVGPEVYLIDDVSLDGFMEEENSEEFMDVWGLDEERKNWGE
jgi:hypothetical protein